MMEIYIEVYKLACFTGSRLGSYYHIHVPKLLELEYSVYYKFCFHNYRFPSWILWIWMTSSKHMG